MQVNEKIPFVFTSLPKVLYFPGGIINGIGMAIGPGTWDGMLKGNIGVGIPAGAIETG